MKSAAKTAVEFLRGRWPRGVPPEAIERAYLSGRLVEEAAHAAVGEHGEERLSDMLSAVWRDEDELQPAGIVIEEAIEDAIEGDIDLEGETLSGVMLVGDDVDIDAPIRFVPVGRGGR